MAIHAEAVTSEGCASSQELALQGHKLCLNGQGERTKFFTTVYIANLFLSHNTNNATQILNAREPQLMRLKIISSFITPDLLRSSIKDGLKLSAGKDYEKYAAMLDQALAANNLVVDKGDQFDFFYIPDKGTYFYRNGEELGQMPSFSFKKVLFGIWLGEQPIQDDLKEDLLTALN